MRRCITASPTLSAVSQLLATLHKFAAAHPETLTSAPATPQVPAPEPVIEKPMETESVAAQPPRQPAQPAAPRIPAVSDDYDGWMTADETRELEHMQRLAAQAYVSTAMTTPAASLTRPTIPPCA